MRENTLKKMETSLADVVKYSLEINGEKYVIKGAFPPRSFTDMNATLADSGLCPNANLFLSKL